MAFTTLIFPLWFSSAWRPSNVELYVLNSVYLDGNGAELATRGDVGVLSFVTDGDFVVGVHEDVVGVWAILAGFVIVGELKSNDNRDLWDTKYEFHVDEWVNDSGNELLPWWVYDCWMIRMLQGMMSWWRAQIDAVSWVWHHHRRWIHGTWHIQCQVAILAQTFIAKLWPDRRHRSRATKVINSLSSTTFPYDVSATTICYINTGWNHIVCCVRNEKKINVFCVRKKFSH